MVECDERPDALLAVTGEQLGTYILSECIGRGGMGAVFRARHATLGREVAIKILSPDRSGDPQAVERFFAEARAVNATRNEHLVQITDFIEDDPRFKYCVMELLEGETLLERLTREPHLEWPLAVDIARQVLSALVDAHAAQIVHRDIKPDNIFLCRPREGSEFPFVKILDFGVAKVGRDRRRLSTTAAGAIIGTPEYMSPEQVSGAVADERSDLYSVAVTLYEMLTGQRPFHGDDFGQLVVAHLTLSPKRPSEIAPQPIPFA
ncbi:MAG: serine/threonine-protein kinase, partial [Myxococcota bacterium]